MCIRREKGRRNSAAQNADRHGGIHIRRRSGEERFIPSPAVIAASLSPLTATAVENTAVMIAIFLTGSGAVTADEQRRITERYALSRPLSIAVEMLANRLITEQEYAEIDTILLQKYRPYLGMLFSENT